MKLSLAGPGLAFWRYDDFGADLWEYGLLSIEPVKNEHGESDWWHLGLKLGTVKSRTSRALAQLRQEVER